jgi:hypothetical protein
MKTLTKFLESIVRSLYGILIGWFVDLIRLLVFFDKRREEQRELKRKGFIFTRCQRIPGTIYKRPDPLIYSQYYLMSQGLAVTWDNPDIQLYQGGMPVPSASLQPDTEYEVRATIYNGSNEAPAVNMPIDFSFLTFGIATVSTFIGRQYVNLPVRGALGHPVTASIIWRTPVSPGHYCLQVNLIWADDANPNNNLGQENTNVVKTQSPAVFEFPVYNDTDGKERVTLGVDTYVLRTPINCDDVLHGRLDFRDPKTGKPITGNLLCKLLAERHERGSFPIPPGWTVQITPNEFDLDPKKSQNVKVTITPPDKFVAGTQAFNINGYNRHHELIGGITLYVQR